MGNIINFSKNQNNTYIKIDYDNFCPICLDIIKDNNIIILDCKHKFHASCIFNSLYHKKYRCPICREKIKYKY
jgi:hypothetical protein